VKYAEVALNLPINELFTYEVTEEMQGPVCAGSRVLVPFRNKKVVGVVVRLSEKTDLDSVKKVQNCLDPYPALTPELLPMLEWVSDYYQCSLGEAIHAALPSLGKGKKHQLDKIPDLDELEAEYEFVEPDHKDPTPEQRNALEILTQKIDKGKFNVSLLYGVTGSGKTEIYLQAIARTLAQKKNALVLVPEIALTYQLIKRFKERFGDKVAVLHSGLLGSHRMKDWRKVRMGEARVVVGVRSAVFAPVQRLGLVVVDEEHEMTFKQDNTPRYHARDVAIMRAKLNNASVILGSATPSLESYYNAVTGKYQMIELTQRIDNRKMPQCEIVDMRQEWDNQDGNQIISSPLHNEIRKRLDLKQQVILFLNRRGFSTILLCRGCGKTIFCTRCAVPLTYHKVTGKVHCHYCGLRMNPPTKCPVCGQELVKYLGLGTQQVEDEVFKLFPDAKVARLDLDITRKRGEYEKILDGFVSGEIDILLGTQMIAKGMDIPNVTLVGVINADMLLSLPDFRSSERAYSLLTQVAGRAGRGTTPGKVIIQTYNPSHYALNAVIRNERHPFYEREIRFRKKLNFPPFKRMLLILFQHKVQAQSLSIAEHFAYLSREMAKGMEGTEVDILGPAAAPLHKLKNYYRYHVLLKSTNPGKMRDIYRQVMEELPKQTRLSGTVIHLDMDPSVLQ
jgi:primosomal protein N' (replication factor Y)